MTVEHSGRLPRPRRETEVQVDRIRSLWPELLMGFEAMRPSQAIVAVMKRVDFCPAPELFPEAYRHLFGPSPRYWRHVEEHMNEKVLAAMIDHIEKRWMSVEKSGSVTERITMVDDATGEIVDGDFTIVGESATKKTPKSLLRNPIEAVRGKKPEAKPMSEMPPDWGTW